MFVLFAYMAQLQIVDCTCKISIKTCMVSAIYNTWKIHNK